MQKSDYPRNITYSFSLHVKEKLHMIDDHSQTQTKYDKFISPVILIEPGQIFLIIIVKMKTFNVFILYSLSCLWRMCSGDKFLSSIAWDSWNHLNADDIKLLAVANFIDDFNECPDRCIQINKLENITTSVVPAVNAAEDPLNKFIGSKR